MSLITSLSRQLRKNMTPAERELWKYLRGRKLNGYKFNSQQPIRYKTIDNKSFYFIADFFCFQQKLIIEIDGGIHLKQIGYDLTREDILKQMGYRILRFKNKEIFVDLYSVLAKIRAYLS